VGRATPRCYTAVGWRRRLEPIFQLYSLLRMTNAFKVIHIRTRSQKALVIIDAHSLACYFNIMDLFPLASLRPLGLFI